MWPCRHGLGSIFPRHGFARRGRREGEVIGGALLLGVAALTLERILFCFGSLLEVRVLCRRPVINRRWGGEGGEWWILVAGRSDDCTKNVLAGVEGIMPVKVLDGVISKWAVGVRSEWRDEAYSSSCSSSLPS